MDKPDPPPPVNGHSATSASPDGLGERAADLAVAAGRHAALLIDEARFRITKAIRESVFSLSLGITLIVFSVIGYALLISQLASWLANSLAWQRPEPAKAAVYLLAALLPLFLLKIRVRWTNESELSALERKHRE